MFGIGKKRNRKASGGPAEVPAKKRKEKDPVPKYGRTFGVEPLVVAAGSTVSDAHAESSEVIVCGTVDGGASSRKAVMIEAAGVVSGKVTAPTVEVSGTVRGGVDCVVLKLFSTGRVEGAVRASSIDMAENATACAQVTMGKWALENGRMGGFRPYNERSDVGQVLDDFEDYASGPWEGGPLSASPAKEEPQPQPQPQVATEQTAPPAPLPQPAAEAPAAPAPQPAPTEPERLVSPTRVLRAPRDAEAPAPIFKEPARPAPAPAAPELPKVPEPVEPARKEPPTDEWWVF